MIVKIALINPPVSKYAPFPFSIMTGLGTLAVYTDSLAHIQIFDGMKNDNDMLTALSDFNPDIAGFTAMTYQAESSFYIARLLKKHNPDVVTVMGGAFAALNPEIVLNHDIDAVVYGEGEMTLRAFAAKSLIQEIPGIYYLHDGNIIKNPSSLSVCPDDIPFRYRDYLPGQGVVKKDMTFMQPAHFVIFSRGCHGKCSFCASHHIWPEYKARSAESAAAEIQYILDIYPKIRNFIIDDDNLLYDHDFCRDFFSIIKPLNIKWRANSRVESVTAEILQAASDAGCVKLSFGVESGSEPIRKAMRKNPSDTVIKSAFDMCEKAGIAPGMLMIAGFPGETADTLKQSRELVKQIKPSGGWDFQVFQPHPGSDAAQFAEACGTIIARGYNDYFSDNITFIPESFTEKEFYYAASASAGRYLGMCGIESALEKWCMGELSEKICIGAQNYFCEQWDEENFYFGGDEGCKSGIGFVAGLKRGFFEYRFFLTKPGRLRIHSRMSAHPKHWGEGEHLSTVVNLMVNRDFCQQQTVGVRHTTGLYYCWEIPERFTKEGENRILFQTDAKKSNGLAIFTRALHVFFEPVQCDLTVEIMIENRCK